jgi:hypothetical protein
MSNNGRIFISYRRNDTAGYARAICDQLVKRFSKERVFMDVDAIEPGLPFDEAISQAVGGCEIFLAMIGKHWMEQQPGISPRINDAKDFVRLEIAAALSRNIRVIPVLFDGASMPTEQDLPEPLRALARRNAIEISNSRFNSDVERLIEAVRRALGESDTGGSTQDPRARQSIIYWLIGGLAVAVLSCLIVYFYLSGLCQKLDGHAIYIDANTYHGMIGPAGIKLQETEDGSFRFATNIGFSNKTKKEFDMEINDPIAGECNGRTINFTRKLKVDGSRQRYSGTISGLPAGSTTIKGVFLDDNNLEFQWSGRVDIAIP